MWPKVFLNETSIIEMVEASSYEELDMLSTLIGLVVERLCGLEYCLIENTFTLSFDLLRLGHRGEMIAGWTKIDLQTLPKNIDDFKSEACRYYANYRQSTMGSRKYHLLEHLIGDLRSVRNIEYLLAKLNEATHESVKRSS